MLELTKEPHIKGQKKEKILDWRDAFSDLLQNTTEQGLYLKGVRLRQGHTQARLGELVGVSQSNISWMEKGKRPIGKKLAHKLAKVLNTDYRRFL
jgi:DNA-binding XRE family transcriptional regulator